MSRPFLAALTLAAAVAPLGARAQAILLAPEPLPDALSALPAPPDSVLAPPAEVSPAPARPQALTADAIDRASYEGGDLPRDRSALTVKLQVLLDRAGISPGVIDGVRGGMTESSLRAFEESQGLTVDGQLDFDVWALLGGPLSGPIMRAYVITPDDERNITPGLPSDYAELATLDWLGYQRVSEMLAERFHMDEDFLRDMNPGAGFTAGETIVVADPGPFRQGQVARIEVRKGENRLAAFDAYGRMVADYPVTIGSPDTPSPEGIMEVTAVAPLPTYHYDPVNFVQGENTEPLTLPAGPNGPVGAMWIDLSKPSYGLHGTPEPSTLFRRASHGCVRLANWDAEELASMVAPGTVVEFVP